MGARARVSSGKASIGSSVGHSEFHLVTPGTAAFGPACGVCVAVPCLSVSVYFLVCLGSRAFGKVAVSVDGSPEQRLRLQGVAPSGTAELAVPTQAVPATSDPLSTGPSPAKAH